MEAQSNRDTSQNTNRKCDLSLTPLTPDRREGSTKDSELSGNYLDIIIDPEFAAISPPLTLEEYQVLEANVVEKSRRVLLSVWREGNILLDGHQRLKICKENNIGYEIELIDIPDREAAIDWIYDNLLAGRHLTPDQLRVIWYERYKREIHQGQRNDLTSRQNGGKLDTPHRLARLYGVSPRTIERAAKDLSEIEENNPEDLCAIKSGKKTLKQIKIESERAAFVEKYRPIISAEIKPIEKRYTCIVIDFPWSD